MLIRDERRRYAKHLNMDRTQEVSGSNPLSSTRGVVGRTWLSARSGNWRAPDADESAAANP